MGITTARIEVFSDDQDAFIAREVQADANGNLDLIKDDEAPWGIHRQVAFTDPSGHIRLVGDRSPLDNINEIPDNLRLSTVH